MTARRDRVLLALLGLGLLAAGVAGLAAGRGLLDGAAQPLLPAAAGEAVRAASPWGHLGLAAAAVLLGLVGLRLVASRLRTDRLGEVELERDRSAGSTVLAAGALAQAVEQDAAAVPGVRRASAVLRGARGGPRLAVRVVLEDRADLAEVRTALESGTVTRARDALGLPALPVDLELRLAPAPARPVL